MPLPTFPSSERIRRHYIFSGVVQGVGFRYEAHFLADRLELVGWIRNRRDGTVEAELEGEREKIDHFVRGMQSIRRIRIANIEAREMSPRMDEDSFDVIY